MNVTPGKEHLGNGAQGVRRLNYRYGRSVSDSNASTDLSLSPSNNKFRITINGDGPHQITLNNTSNLKTGNDIAHAIQNSVRLIRASSTNVDLAFSQFVCAYDGETGRYILVSGMEGTASAVVVTDAPVGNVASALKLGTLNGGVEDSFYPRQNRYASLVDVATLPLPVIVEGFEVGELDVEVDLSHLDNFPEPGDVADSVRIGDGTEEVSVSVENRLEVQTEAGVRTPTIANVSATLANTEYSYALPNNTKRFLIRVREGKAKLQLAYNNGDSGSNYITLELGTSLVEDSVIMDTGMTLYFQVNKYNQIIEILSWA